MAGTSDSQAERLSKAVGTQAKGTEPEQRQLGSGSECQNKEQTQVPAR